MEKERKAEAERQAQIERERKAEAERNAEAERQAEAERKAEQERLARLLKEREQAAKSDFVPAPEIELNNIVFVLSPNPAVDFLRVNADEVIPNEVRMDVQDSDGKVLKSATLKKPKGRFEATIPIEELPNGVYFLKIYVENTQYVQRFRKEK